MEQHAFELVSKYKPEGDQPEAIRQLVDGIRAGKRFRHCSGRPEREKRLRFRM